MSPKYSILGILALGILLLLVFKNYEIWTQPMELLPKPQKEETKPLERKAEALPATGPAKDTLSIQSHISIAEKNIFSPDRKDFLIPGGANKPMVRPQIVLYGVTILEDYQAASIANPGRPLPKGERETFTIKLGEKIGEYKLASISSDRIILEADGDRFEVLLYDPRMPKKRMEVKTEVKPATVTSTLPTPQTATPKTVVPTPPPVSAEAPKTSPPSTTVTPSPPATGGTELPSSGARGVRRGRTIYYPPGTPAQGTGGN